MVQMVTMFQIRIPDLSLLTTSLVIMTHLMVNSPPAMTGLS